MKTQFEVRNRREKPDFRKCKNIKKYVFIEGMRMLSFDMRLSTF